MRDANLKPGDDKAAMQPWMHSTPSQSAVLHRLSGGELAVTVTHGGLVDHHGRHHVMDCAAELGQLG